MSACFFQTYPFSRANRTKPLRLLKVTEFFPGAHSRDSAAPPTTITTAFPVPLHVSR